MDSGYKIRHFLFALPLLIPHLLFPQSRNIKTEHLTIDDGLSNNAVYAITQDSRGFMWFGTANGLNRYDGYEFRQFYYDPDDSTSLSNNFVWSIHEDRNGALWIGTVDGLNKFDREKERFTHYKHNPDDATSLSSSYIRVVFEDRTGTLWLGSRNGLNRFDREQERFVAYNLNPANPEQLGSNTILAIHEDQSGMLWVGTGDGLFQYGREKDALVQPDYWRQFFSSRQYDVSSIYRDQSGFLWFGCWGEGLLKINLKARTIVRFDKLNGYPAVDALYKDKTGPFWVGSDEGLFQLNHKIDALIKFDFGASRPDDIRSIRIRKIYQDRSGVIWVGTHSHGLYKLTEKTRKFNNFHPELNQPGQAHFNAITAIIEDIDGTYWIGTDGYGLYRFDQETGKFGHYLIDPDYRIPGGQDHIETMFLDSHGELWVGASFDGGLHRYDRKAGRFIHFMHDPENPASLSGNDIAAIYEDRLGALWIGTDSQGLSRFDREEGTFSHYKHQPGNPASLSSNKIRAILDADAGGLWVATWGGGLNLLDRDQDAFVHFRHIPGDPHSLSDDRVNSLLKASNGDLWIGTSAGGLNKFDRKAGTFVHFTIKDGLPSNTIYGILDDHAGNLWISMDKGLSRFDIRTGKFKNYDVADGLPGNEFSEKAYYKNSRGELFFGGKKGFTVFHPDSIRDNPFMPPVVLTDFHLFNKPAVLDTVISEKRRLALDYDENVISFTFAALNFIAPHKNRYRYKMQGVDQDWVEAGAQRFASYSNLAPGEYTFHLKASNNDGLWNEEGTSVRISIFPPWWRTNLAYAFYALLFGAALYGWRRFELNRVRLKNELKSRQFEADKLREIDQLKSHFFANISHEFRTPLTLILGPIEKMLLHDVNDDAREELNMMQRNGNRLLRLINQLLDLSRLEAGRMQLQKRPENITVFLKGLANQFASLADRKKITFKVNGLNENIFAAIDRDKFEKMITNLLSNAFKFTPERGTVEVNISVQSGAADNPAKSETLEITVADSGAGIPAAKLKKIFDRFYQIDGSDTREFAGSGIGLALTKELVELHGGELFVESEPGKGAVFTVRLPLERTERPVTENIPAAQSGKSLQPKADFGDRLAASRSGGTAENDARQESRSDKSLPLILIVEDNSDVRKYMISLLAGEYQIIEAQDGVEGLKQATANAPDLILSDVMMPKMNGFVFCKKIKTDESTSHIPVILLTARASGESKVEGLETGADDYITKPFDAKELQVRVKNLIEQRRRLRERFRREVTLQPKDIAVTSMDERFIGQAMEIVEKFLADEDFSVEDFAGKIGMSRQHLNRKLRALTDASAGDFIRIMRLKRAAQLLEKQSATVTEISYMVGFTNPSYFAERFKEQFGRLPSEYGSGD